jgi:hypothetical protein
LKKIKKAEGDIFKVPVDTSHSYAIALRHPLFGFFDILTTQETDVSDLEERPLLFSVWVMDYAVKDGTWSKIGHTDKFRGRFDGLRFFKQDRLNGRLTSYRDEDGDEFQIDFDTATRMEAAAVWDPKHIESRLRDYFAGRCNKWVDSLKPRPIP